MRSLDPESGEVKEPILGWISYSMRPKGISMAFDIEIYRTLSQKSQDKERLKIAKNCISVALELLVERFSYNLKRHNVLLNANP